MRWACAAVVVAIAGSGCAARGGHAASPLGGSRTSWRYDVVPVAGGDELAIETWLPPGSLSDLVVKSGAEPFVRDLEVEDADGWSDVARRGATFHVPECSRGCHLRYRFALRRAATALHSVDEAKAWGPVIEASPSLWLLHPTLAPAGTRYRFHVPAVGADGEGTTFVTGVFAAEDGPPDTFEADAANMSVAPYAAFGPMHVHHVEAVSGTTLDVAVVPGSFAADDAAIVDWASHSARTMARFFGCFPIARVMVLVVPEDGTTVRHGETMGDGGASIVVELGTGATREALAADWVLPHEMTHLAVPSVTRKHHWLEEGLAVYLQPIARARAGEIAPEEVWREFAIGMPQGVPASGPEALDGARDWARVYWGGATFCLMADLEIRTRTRNRFGLADALRGVLASGGSVANVWDFQRVLETADSAVGVPALEQMHEVMRRRAWAVDLPALFRALGVIVDGQSVRLVDDAPLASLRRAITEPLPEAPEPAACPWATPSRMAQR